MAQKMKKYIDVEKLIAEIEDKLSYYRRLNQTRQVYDYVIYPLEELLEYITSNQQEQPIEGKQTIIITETNGDANIHWDCRSLEDVMLLLESAKSYISDKQIEELRGPGSGPDYNTTEGRFRNAHKFKQEQSEVDFEKELDEAVRRYKPNGDFGWGTLYNIAYYFYELGRNARKNE